MIEKIVVPEGMLKAAKDVYHDKAQDGVDQSAVKEALKAALRWLSEHPIVPTDEQHDVLYKEFVSLPETRIVTNGTTFRSFFRWAIDAWQRRMFLAPEPEIPDIWMSFVRNAPEDAVSMTIFSANGTELKKIDLKAFRRGKASK